MKPLPYLLLIFLFIPKIAQAQDAKGVYPAGRYAITFSSEGLYFLDTSTGDLWLKADHQQEWKRVASPVSPLPAKLAQEQNQDKPVALELPGEEAIMPMIQRELRAIPGSSESLFVQLGDITGEQVFVEVVDVNGKFLAERTSLKNEEFLEFKVDKRTVYLQVIDMVNNLFGDDICKVRISYKKPKVEKKQENQKTKDKKKSDKVK